jgi:hypothetical protein
LQDLCENRLITGAAQVQSRVAVVIPVYVVELDAFEKIALDRCLTILKAHDIYLAHPRHLDIAALTDQWPSLKTMPFDDHYFRSIKSYSLLCKSALFYSAFRKYRHLLIYQLDAYVFRDSLLDWCRSDIGYIGAPWLHYEQQMTSLKPWVRSRALRPFLGQVGNGGLSLRMVSRFHMAAWMWGVLAKATPEIPEDVYWCNLIKWLFPLSIARLGDALAFSFDKAPEECWQMNGQKLPFGCHAWHTKHLAFWRRHIDEL